MFELLIVVGGFWGVEDDIDEEFDFESSKCCWELDFLVGGNFWKMEDLSVKRSYFYKFVSEVWRWVYFYDWVFCFNVIDKVIFSGCVCKGFGIMIKVFVFEWVI